MKRCPECRRDYTDDTLLYCLDDGTALLDGPAAADESKTAILPGSELPAIDQLPSESPTQTFKPNAVSEPDPVSPINSDQQSNNAASRRNSIMAGVLGILLILALAIGGFWLYGTNSGSPDTQIETIAVMPFVNESGNPDVEYLSDGMTETLISRLSQLSNLNVKARSSVFRYKGKDTDVKTIAKELNV